MIDQFVRVAERLIEGSGIAGVFLAAIIEEIIAPIPSGLVMMSAGYSFLSGEPLTIINLGILFLTVALPLSLGLTIGSTIVYGLTYKYGEVVIKKFGKYLFISYEDVEKVKKKFSKNYKDEFMLFLLRLLPVIPSVALNTLAGILKIKPTHYLLATFTGSLVRSFAIGFLGWQAGNLYKEYALQIDHYENYAFGVVLAIIIIYIFHNYLRNRKFSI